MTKEEFVDKIGIANMTISNIKKTIGEMERTKREAVSVFLESNMKFDPNQRVKVYHNTSETSCEQKEFVGYGYVRGAVVDEDYGVIVYPIVKESKKTKSPTNESFQSLYKSDVGVTQEDFEHCNIIIEIA